MANKRDVLGLRDMQQKWLENPLQPGRFFCCFFSQAFPYPKSVLCVFCSAAAAAGNSTTFEMWGLLDGVPLWLRAPCHCEPQTLLWKHIWPGALKTTKGQKSYFSAVRNGPLPMKSEAQTLQARCFIKTKSDCRAVFYWYSIGMRGTDCCVRWISLVRVWIGEVRLVRYTWLAVVENQTYSLIFGLEFLGCFQ